MKEKILTFLMANLVGIQKSYLEGVAENFSKTITEESQIATTLNEGVLSALKHSAELIQKESDRRATEASQTAIANYEKKHNLKEGKAIEEKKEEEIKVEIPAPTTPEKKEEGTPEWAKALIESNKAMTEKITALEQDKILQSKKSEVQKALEGSKLPDNLKEKWAGRVDVDSETAIEEQVKELETEYDELHTKIIGDHSGKGLPTGSGEIKGEVTDEEAQEILDKL